MKLFLPREAITKKYYCKESFSARRTYTKIDVLYFTRNKLLLSKRNKFLDFIYLRNFIKMFRNVKLN